MLVNNRELTVTSHFLIIRTSVIISVILSLLLHLFGGCGYV